MLKNFAAEPHLDKENKACESARESAQDWVATGAEDDAPPVLEQQGGWGNLKKSVVCGLWFTGTGQYRVRCGCQANAALMVDQWQTALRALGPSVCWNFDC